MALFVCVAALGAVLLIFVALLLRRQRRWKDEAAAGKPGAPTSAGELASRAGKARPAPSLAR